MIYIEDKTIKIGSVTLPGIVKDITIHQDALIEEQEIKGKSSKVNQATGYEDAKVEVTLLLDDTEKETKMEKLQRIQSVFKTQNQKKPKVYPLINEHTTARKINKVIFKSLKSKVSNETGLLTVNIELWQYNPVSINSSRSGGSESRSSSVSGLSEEYKEYLSERNKISVSPAADNASADLTKVRLLPY